MGLDEVEGLFPDSIVLVFPGGTSQANRPKMNETVNHKMVQFFSHRTILDLEFWQLQHLVQQPKFCFR